MAKQADPGAVEKKKLQEEKKKLKETQKQQRRETKQRAKEIAKKKEELQDMQDEKSGVLTFFATLLIVLIWLAVVVVVVKLDVGGFGSNVLTPVLKDVPVLKLILPSGGTTSTPDGEDSGEFSSMREALDYIRQLEQDLERAQSESNLRGEDITNLKAENDRLKEFENRQLDFQRIQTEFFDEVIYSDKGLGPEEYRKFYEAMDPATAEYFYKQVVAQQEEDKEVLEYVAAYSSANMKPKQAAAIIEAMQDNLSLSARILNKMNAQDRGAILGEMDPDVAARLTKIMDPES